MIERELVQQFGDARKQLADAKDAQKRAQAEYDRIEAQVIEHLEARQANATAKYEGLGYVQIQKPRLYASCTQDNMNALIAYLQAKHRGDLIKTLVQPQTLSTYVTEMLSNGEEIPGMISYYLKPSVRIYT